MHTDVLRDLKADRGEIQNSKNSAADHQAADFLGRGSRHCQDSDMDVEGPAEMRKGIHLIDLCIADHGFLTLCGNLCRTVECADNFYPVPAAAGVAEQGAAQTAGSDQHGPICIFTTKKGIQIAG